MRGRHPPRLPQLRPSLLANTNATSLHSSLDIIKCRKIPLHRSSDRTRRTLRSANFESSNCHLHTLPRQPSTTSEYGESSRLLVSSILPLTRHLGRCQAPSRHIQFTHLRRNLHLRHFCHLHLWSRNPYRISTRLPCVQTSTRCSLRQRTRLSSTGGHCLSDGGLLR